MTRLEQQDEEQVKETGQNKHYLGLPSFFDSPFVFVTLSFFFLFNKTCRLFLGT